jgi:hypothetical protein
MDRFIARQVEQLRKLVGVGEPRATAIDAAEMLRESYSPALIPLELELRTAALRHPNFESALLTSTGGEVETRAK